MINISGLLEFVLSGDYPSLATRLHEISQLVLHEYRIGFVIASIQLISELPEIACVRDRREYTDPMLGVMSSVTTEVSRKLGKTPRDLPKDFQPFLTRLDPTDISKPVSVNLSAIQNDPMSSTDSEAVLKNIHTAKSVYTSSSPFQELGTLENPSDPEDPSRIAGIRAEGILNRVGFTNRVTLAPDWSLEPEVTTQKELPNKCSDPEETNPELLDDRLNTMGNALSTDVFIRMVNDQFVATSKRYQSMDSVLGLKGKLRSHEICRDLEEASRLLCTSSDLPIIPEPDVWDSCPRIYAKDLLTHALVDAINIVCAFPAKLPYPVARPYRSFTNEEASEAGLTVEYTGAIAARLAMEIAYISIKGTLPFVGKEKVSVERTALACMAGLELMQLKVADKPLFMSAIWLFVTEACDEHVVGQLIVDSVVPVAPGLLKV